MLLGHADESYTANFYYMAALLTPDREAVSLTRALDAVVGKAAAAYGVDPMAELHGLHFAPSRDSRLLQAADLIAFLYRRRTTHVEPDARAVRANDQLWALIAPKVAHDWTWRP